MPSTTGEVLIFDALNLQAINVIEAHRSPLSCICLNDAGTLLATASDKGTIIRVFAVPSAKKLYQFRRGSMPSRIYSMAFNATSTLLCVSSASDTVHIFKLSPPSPSDQSSTSNTAKRKDSMDSTNLRPRSSHSAHNTEAIREESPAPSESQPGDDLSRTISNGIESTSIPTSQRKANGTFMGMIRRTSQNVGTSFAASVGAYLPTAVSEMWEPTRDFAWLKIPKPSATLTEQGSPGQRIPSSGSGLGSTAPLKSVVAMSHNSPEVMVVTNEGRFYVFGIDLEKGGEGNLVKVYEVGAEGERMGSVMEEL
ncbi:MAG: hypothetical protein Q9218_001602 [Villophora microphyllina]